jgi:alcohol dehydrogenase
MMSYMFYAPTRVLFGAGQLSKLHEQTMPGKKAMLVISNGKSTWMSGALDRTTEQLRAAGVEMALFDKVGANPLKSIVEEGADFARSNGCDFVVALGGGSVMDAAKVMAMYAPQPGDLWDYVPGATGKMQPLVNPVLPWVAITTTAGTGSEVDQWGVVTNPATNEKIGCGGMDSLFPVLAVVDPELMATVPAKFTAYQGFDALFHSTEGFISKANSLMSDMVQLAAIENVGKYLARAVRDGSDMEAREHMAFANTMSGYSMVVGACTSEHAMEHAMSAYHGDLPHGAGLIMISKEYYTHFVNKHCCDDRFIRMAKALGKQNASDPMDFVTALVELQEACGVADLKMSDYGIQRDDCITLAQNARATMGGLFGADPVPMTDEECAAIFERAYR